LKFIHAADIHLDSPLTGLSAYQDAPAELLRTATRDAFDNLITHAIAEKVDFVIIAGDLYDGSWRDFNTGIFFVRQMGRLRAAGIPVYVLLGNHDAESEMTRSLKLPDNVHQFPANKAETFKLPGLNVALHGRSFRVAATQENLALTYPDPIQDWLNIGVLHTALEGNPQHPSYAPCSIAELEARGYQYWALGHVHEHRIIRNACTIAFPGNLQGRHVRETGARGALLVTANGQDIEAVDRLFVDVLRWENIEIDVSAAQTLSEAVIATGKHLETLVNGCGHSLPLAVRVTLTGASPAHGQLYGLESQLRAEVLGQAVSMGSDRLWVEKVRVATSPVESEADIAARADALADLQSVLAGAHLDEELLKSMQDELTTLIGKLPPGLVNSIPLLQKVVGGDVAALVHHTAPSLLAHLYTAG